MKKFLILTASAALMGSAVIQPINTYNNFNIVHASERAMFAGSTGIYPDRYGSARKAIVGATSAEVIEKSDDGWFKVKTYLGEMWMKSGFAEAKNPDKPAEYFVTTQTSGLFSGMNSGVNNGSIPPQRVLVLEHGDDGWMKINTWKGAMWIKDGVLEIAESSSPVAPAPEITKPGLNIPFGPVQFPEKDPFIGFYTITKSSGMYSDPSTAERLGVVNPQRVYLVERGANGWVKINSNWGQVWIKDGYNAYRAWFNNGATFYRTPNGAKVTNVPASFINVVEERADGWKLVETWLGNLWTKDASSLVPHKFPANNALNHIYVTQDTPIMENMLGEFEQVGIAKGGQTFVIIGETDQSYIIDFGYGEGHINKQHATINDDARYQNRITKQEGNKVIITKKDVIVYDLKGEFYHQVGSIDANMRYPIVGEVQNFYLVDFAGREGYVAKTSVKVDKGVPVLMYHHFLHPGENDTYINAKTTVTVQNFDNQMKYLHQNGFKSAMPGDIERFISRQTNLPGKVATITMDDGYKSNAIYAAPILAKYGYKGTVFFSTQWLQARTGNWDPSYLQWMSTDEIKNTANALEHQSHTDLMHHSVNGSGAINKWAYADAVADIKNNLDKLEAASGYRPTHFAYPFGSYSDQAINVLKANGIKTAYTIKKGYVNPGDNPYLLNRFDIHHFVPMSQFIEYLGHN